MITGLPDQQPAKSGGPSSSAVGTGKGCQGFGLSNTVRFILVSARGLTSTVVPP